MAKEKKKTKVKRTEKFFLGLHRIIRDLIAAQAKIERSIKTGTKRVKQGGPDDVVKANRKSLAGSREANRIVNTALRDLNKAPCLDQFMNCDPEYFRAAAARRGTR